MKQKNLETICIAFASDKTPGATEVLKSIIDNNQKSIIDESNFYQEIVLKLVESLEIENPDQTSFSFSIMSEESKNKLIYLVKLIPKLNEDVTEIVKILAKFNTAATNLPIMIFCNYPKTMETTRTFLVNNFKDFAFNSGLLNMIIKFNEVKKTELDNEIKLLDEKLKQKQLKSKK